MLARVPWGERYPRAKGGVGRLAARACHYAKDGAEPPIPASLVRSAAVCYGYGHAISGVTRAAIHLKSLEPVPDQRQCNPHWQVLHKMRQVRAGP
jgi:hypothetical protein